MKNTSLIIITVQYISPINWMHLYFHFPPLQWSPILSYLYPSVHCKNKKTVNRIKYEQWMDGWVDEWVDGWMERKITSDAAQTCLRLLKSPTYCVWDGLLRLQREHVCEKHTETHADSQHVDPNVAAALEPANRADQSKTCEVFFFFFLAWPAYAI